METKKLVAYFGAAGAGLAYCQHSGILPDIFVDNDQSKWGTFINGVEVMSPEVLTSISLQQVVVTSGYITDIYAQILSLGVGKDKVVIPPKALLGLHPFEQENNRIEATTKLHEIMTTFSDRWKIVSVGGTALGFCRSGDFIHWDFDIDLFAPTQSKTALFDFFQHCGYAPKEELNSIKATLMLENGVKIPFGVDFFDADSATFIDRYEDYTWEWSTQMFTQCSQVEVHGKLLNVPNPFDEYLGKVYGSSWSVPNPEFGYSDYAGNLS